MLSYDVCILQVIGKTCQKLTLTLKRGENLEKAVNSELLKTEGFFLTFHKSFSNHLHLVGKEKWFKSHHFFLSSRGVTVAFSFVCNI